METQLRMARSCAVDLAGQIARVTNMVTGDAADAVIGEVARRWVESLTVEMRTMFAMTGEMSAAVSFLAMPT